jgi:hypothetical protein
LRRYVHKKQRYALRIKLQDKATVEDFPTPARNKIQDSRNNARKWTIEKGLLTQH